MTRRTSLARRGLSMVAVIAAAVVVAAVPLQTSTVRRAAAASACKTNLAAIAAVESAHALRHDGYTAKMSDLVGAPEGLSKTPACPLDGKQYKLTLDATDGQLTIACPNAKAHGEVASPAASYTLKTPAPAAN